MTDNSSVSNYPQWEERINIASHAIGCVLGVIATIALVHLAIAQGQWQHIVSFSIYGASMVVLYAASALYHSAKTIQRRRRLKVFDHAAIYILIAGSYTPFTLTVLEGFTGIALLVVIWAFALTGVVLKLFFTGRYKALSTSMYVVMGWLVIFVIKPLADALPEQGLHWLVAGGVAYTVGALFYAFKNIPGTHAIFHVLVLVGTACQFVTVYRYIL